MNAPVIWILLPLGASGLFWLLRRLRNIATLGGTFALLLAGVATFIPIDLALRIGPWSFKIAPALDFLGRRLVLSPEKQPLLPLIYGLVAIWFFGARAAAMGQRLIPFGLAITALLIASLAVEPFLYAAMFIEIAVLLAVPMLTSPSHPATRGAIRFLIYQTLAMPFILLAGWLLPGVEASPGDLALAVESAALLGLGFAFLLAIFPLYTWIPLLTEEAPPYLVGFLLWLLPTVILFFGLGFLDRYSWLRTSQQLPDALRLAGLLMVTTGGVWSALQRHLGRMMGYAAIAESGLMLLSLTLELPTGIETAFLFLIPHAFGLALWVLALTTMATQGWPLHLDQVRGAFRRYPLAATALILAQLSTAGFPLLAGFPPRLALLEGMAHQSLAATFWLLTGMLGLLLAAIRVTFTLSASPAGTAWEWRETGMQRVLLGLGTIFIFAIGLFPQIVHPLLVNLPAIFEHLGR
ncbi:MAG: hypothetical protein D6770_03765 [Anaerolineae bacterium]|nr:MAG: hypothetical protein D6770_03765 [Anaerolineae bacterium]